MLLFYFLRLACVTVLPVMLLVTTVQYLRTKENVVRYVRSNEHVVRKIPVDSAKCDQIQGWGNITRNVLGIDRNVCQCHALGKAQRLFLSCQLYPYAM